MVHGKNCIPCRIDRRLTGLAELNMMPLSRAGCSLSLKTHNMGNPGQELLLVLVPLWAAIRDLQHVVIVVRNMVRPFASFCEKEWKLRSYRPQFSSRLWYRLLPSMKMATRRDGAPTVCVSESYVM